MLPPALLLKRGEQLNIYKDLVTKYGLRSFLNIVIEGEFLILMLLHLFEPAKDKIVAIVSSVHLVPVGMVTGVYPLYLCVWVKLTDSRFGKFDSNYYSV